MGDGPVTALIHRFVRFNRIYSGFGSLAYRRILAEGGTVAFNPGEAGIEIVGGKDMVVTLSEPGQFLSIPARRVANLDCLLTLLRESRL